MKRRDAWCYWGVLAAAVGVVLLAATAIAAAAQSELGRCGLVGVGLLAAGAGMLWAGWSQFGGAADDETGIDVRG